MYGASSESRISPLTASAVDTSNHITPYRSTFHSCASRSRAHVCSSPCCHISAAGNTQFLQYSRKIDSVWPSTDVVHTDLILDKLLRMWLCISFHDRVFVNRSAPLSTPATVLKFRSPLAAFSWIHKKSCPDASICRVPVGPQWRGLRSHLPIPLRSYACRVPIVSADAFTKPYNSASAELSATTAYVLQHILMR